MTAPADPNDPTAGRFPSADGAAALRDALGAYLRGSRSPPEEARVCTVLDALAREARARGLHGEHLLLTLKQVWTELPEAAAMPDLHERQRVLGHLVTLCLTIYYGQG